MFYDLSLMTSADLSKFNTSNVTDMKSMFSSCSSLTSLDLSKFDTSKVTNMSSMFYKCSTLASLDVSGFDTGKVERMSSMFYECRALTNLDLSSFDTQKVTNMENLITNCSGLETFRTGAKFVNKWSGVSNKSPYPAALPKKMYKDATGEQQGYGDTVPLPDGAHTYATTAHTVTFDSDGGSTVDPQTVADTATAVTPTCTKDGYTCTGWTLNGAAYDFSTPVTADLTLKAVWREGTGYIVTFNAAGGSTVASQTVAAGKTASEPTPPTKTGYDCTGWTLDGKTYDFSTAVNADITLKAVWTPHQFTITYNLGDGGTTTNPTTYTIETETFTLSAPTKAGYDFRYWVSGTGLNGVTTEVTIPKGSVGDREYTADWLQHTYHIVRQYRLENADGSYGNYYRLTKNGGVYGEYYYTGENIAAWNRPEDGTYQAASIPAYTVGAEDKTFSVDVNRFTAENTIKYRLQNADGTYGGDYQTGWTGTLRVGESHTWTRKADETYQETSGTITCPTRNANISQYQQYVDVPRITYTIKLDGNGGSNPADEIRLAGNTVGSLPSSTRAGYNFEGWYTEKTGGTQITGSEEVSNTTFYAHWSDPIVYTISYNLDGGAQEGNPTQYTVESDAITLKNPSKTGYTFTGWSGTGLTGSSNTSVTIAKGSIGNREYTAHYSRNSYTVKFDTDGGSEAPENQTIEYGNKVTKPADPTRDGYTFLYWNLNDTEYDFEVPVTSDITLKATWKEVTKDTPSDPGETPDPGTKTDPDPGETPEPEPDPDDKPSDNPSTSTEPSDNSTTTGTETNAENPTDATTTAANTDSQATTTQAATSSESPTTATTTGTSIVEDSTNGTRTTENELMATVNDNGSATISAEDIARIVEAAGTDATITAKVADATVELKKEDLKAGKTLTAYTLAEDGKTLVMTGKKVTIASDSSITIPTSIIGYGNVSLLNARDSKATDKAIIKTLKLAKTKMTLKVGLKVSVKLSSKFNTANIKTINYKSSNTKIATVSKKGKITAKRKGTAKIIVFVTLLSGQKKTLTLTVKVK